MRRVKREGKHLLLKFKSRPHGVFCVLHLLKLHFENRHKKSRKPHGIWDFCCGIYEGNTIWLAVCGICRLRLLPSPLSICFCGGAWILTPLPPAEIVVAIQNPLHRAKGGVSNAFCIWSTPPWFLLDGSTPSFSPIVLSNFIVFLSENRKFPGAKKPTVAFFARGAVSNRRFETAPVFVRNRASVSAHLRSRPSRD